MLPGFSEDTANIGFSYQPFYQINRTSFNRDGEIFLKRQCRQLAFSLQLVFLPPGRFDKVRETDERPERLRSENPG
jgi:hypothetical protein